MNVFIEMSFRSHLSKIVYLRGIVGGFSCTYVDCEYDGGATFCGISCPVKFHTGYKGLNRFSSASFSPSISVTTVPIACS